MPVLRPLRGPKLLHRHFSALSKFRSNAALLKGAPLDIHPEVEDALAHNKPVVALETALVTHGLPYPSSLQVPLSLEQIVRSTGSIPATIGIIGGRVKIGLTREELDRLASRKLEPAKVSRRDIAAAISLKADGGTTCSGTLVFSALAGIKVFATGGLGGVHRGGENSLDISADLHELTRCPVGLVSSGVKSILDIKRTLEYLETLGVPVITYGDSKEFPAFFSRHSGHNVPWNIDNPSAVAAMLYAQWQFGMRNGAMIAVPIPEEYEKIGKEIQEYVNQAVSESGHNGISKSGKDATPWLLKRIAELSAGKSLPSNIALLESTALVGGQIAVKYQELVNQTANKSRDKIASSTYHPLTNLSASSFADHANLEDVHHPPASVVVIGSAAVDITSQELPNTKSALAVHSTAPGHVSLSLGGVGRNIAEASHRIMGAKFPSLSTILISSVGYDSFGHLLVDKLNDFGMRSDGLIRLDHASAVCNMVLDSKGTLVGGVADMTITDTMTGEVILPLLKKHTPTMVALDGNLTPAAITSIVEYCEIHAIQVLFEPTSTIKSTSIIPAIRASQGVNVPAKPVAFCTPNLLELGQIYEAAQSDLFELGNSSWRSAITSFNLGSAYRNDLEQLARRPSSDEPGSKATLDFLIQQGIAQKAVHLLPFFQHLIIKCGEQGVLVAMCIDPKDASTSGWANLRSDAQQRYVVARGNSDEIIVLQHFPSLPVAALENVTGAGDSFVGALLATLASDTSALYHPKSLKSAISTAQKAAVLTLQSHSAVSPSLSSIDEARVYVESILIT